MEEIEDTKMSNAFKVKEKHAQVMKELKELVKLLKGMKEGESLDYYYA